MTEKERFFDWCQGGASILYTGYYYFPNAKNDLGEILKETEAEKKKYSEDEACYLLTSLLYREIKGNMEVQDYEKVYNGSIKERKLSF